MRENNLKPCPFCGGKAAIKAIIKRKTGFTIWCGCKKCGVKALGYCPNIENEDTSMKNIEECKKMAIAEWNKRTCSCKKQE